MPYLQEAKKVQKVFRDRAFAKENRTMLYLSNSWGNIAENLSGMIDKLSKLENLSEDKLFKLALYKKFLTESEVQITKYNQLAKGVIENSQQYFGKLGIDSSRAMIEIVTNNYSKLNYSLIENFIGKTSDGSPLQLILNKSFPEVSDKINNTLLNGIALGQNPRVIAKNLANNLDVPLSRALTISRTESMQIYREMNVQQMETSGVCKGYLRVEANDACPECQELDGKKYDFSDEPDWHPNCRGYTIPDI